jgi:hypothetical protein
MTTNGDRSEVAVDVHALVQDAYDVDDAFGSEPIKQRLRPGSELAIAGADLVAGPADQWIRRGALDGTLKFAQVFLGLIDAPAVVVVGVVPDPLQVCLRGRCEKVSVHLPRDFSARLRPRKASKSNGVEAPLVSPVSSASRSARSWVSRSSSSRNGADDVTG